MNNNTIDNYFNNYIKYKLKYMRLKNKLDLGYSICLYYGLYDIIYKIHHEYKNFLLSNDNFTVSINYLNDTNLANKCFNDCIKLLKKYNKYCRKINDYKCVPKCDEKDVICDKTIFNINPSKINIINNEKINSKYDGLINYIEKIIPLNINNTKYFIVIIKNSNNDKIIMFPSGYRYSKHEFFKFIDFNKLYIDLFIDDTPTQNYVLCGHSMGSTLLQILITCSNMIYNDNLINRCFIVGSGTYLWCNSLEIINNFIQKYDSRYIFFGYGINNDKTNIIDDYLFSKGLDDDINNIKLYSFPTQIIVSSSKINNNILTIYDKMYYIKLFIIFTVSSKYKIYVYENINYPIILNKENIVIDVKPKNFSSITNLEDYDLIDLHSWNIYSKIILFFLNL